MAANKSSNGGAAHTFRMAINSFSYVILIIGVSLALSAFAIAIANDVLALVKEEKVVTIALEKETSLNEVAAILKENDIITYPWVFRMFGKFKEAESFKAGKFELDTDMDYGQIIDTLNRAATNTKTASVTIPEGFTIRQIAELMEDKLVCSAEDFIETANTYEYSHAFLQDVPMKENRLEGYLFPDTYEFYQNERPVSVINKLLNNFDKRYTKEMRELTEQAGMSMAEVVNIASLIEKEAKLDDERTTISGVIRNRLNSDSLRLLQIDASILYVTGHKEALTAQDLQIDSPYNTYKNPGLPPTAICNPGVKSLLAAISPEKHKYYFYVLDPDTGAHIFSKTLDEHNAAKNRVGN